MKAAVITDQGLHVVERPDPVADAAQVLVRVRATGINNADLSQVAGRYPAPFGDPADIPGLELAGEIVAVGPAAGRFAAGDRVMALVGGGAHAELASVHERLLLPVPEGVDWEVAGGFVEAYATAHDALFTQCTLAAGERLLVTGAAGGVGSAAVQLGLTAGATVVASVRTESVRAQVAALGAAVCAPDEVEGPFDVVIELVGGEGIARGVGLLATNGRLVVIGANAGRKAEIDFMTLMQRRARICASTLRARPLEEKALVVRRLERHVLPLLADGRLGVPVCGTYPLDEVTAAYDRFAVGGKFGKVVVLP